MDVSCQFEFISNKDNSKVVVVVSVVEVRVDLEWGKQKLYFPNQMPRLKMGMERKMNQMKMENKDEDEDEHQDKDFEDEDEDECRK